MTKLFNFRRSKLCETLLETLDRCKYTMSTSFPDATEFKTLCYTSNFASPWIVLEKSML